MVHGGACEGGALGALGALPGEAVGDGHRLPAGTGLLKAAVPGRVGDWEAGGKVYFSIFVSYFAYREAEGETVMEDG